MKVRLTKKRLQALDNAITFDDILHEKFQRMYADLRKRALEIERMDIEVLAMTSDDSIRERLPIVNIERGPNFVRVTVAK